MPGVPDRVGVRFSPTNPFNDMTDSDPLALFTYAADALNPYSLAYLHILEALPGHMFAVDHLRVSPQIRQVFQGPMLLNGGYDATSGECGDSGRGSGCDRLRCPLYC